MLQEVKFLTTSDWKIHIFWMNESLLQAPDPLIRMDAVTLKAVMEGITTVPSGRIHGGVWLRVLRTILDEISLPTTIINGMHKRLIEPFWKEINLSFRYGLARWRPFEDYKQESQYILMQVAFCASFYS